MPRRSAPPGRAPDPGRAAERTRLAWARTALAFAAVGAVILRTNVPAGLVVLATSPVIWALGHIVGAGAGAPTARRLGLVSGTIVAVALVALGVALTTHGRS